MEVVFSGFDDGGWWLVVLGCRRIVRGSLTGQKMPQNSSKSREELVG